MAKKQVRDSAYYEERLKRDHPSVYADLKSGKHSTVTDAAIAAGLKKARTRLQELRNAWTKADAVEQADFLRWLAASGAGSPRMSRPASIGVTFKVAVDRRLTAEASRRINEIMSKRHLKPGDVMAELGYSRLNASVGMALARGTQLKPDVIVALQKWLAANAGA
ncbi:hypothetical protein [Phyllobacterium leguminum]|uniref:Uncharacterized protein n=1 Tax=Phyllobacterium leguminum TaxID=314237 RepID=A0A318T1A5_9HYPH|nr:hypothetical protein [Phyllobacterium leguminum]PYE88057.1 hypothetical protein C7477_109101 [Phyllobacterium leguminum]